MALLNDEIKNEVKEALGDLENPVRLVMFTQEFECQFCKETRQLVTEVGELSDQIEVEVLNFVTDKKRAEEYAVEKIPAIVVLGAKDYGIRLYGIPSGYEFSSLIESIRLASSGVPDLSPDGLAFAQSIEDPVHIQVYVTPTCPYCPRAVVLGFNLAMANDLVTADMVEATEFPHLAQKYQVMGVPRSVINEAFHIEGAAPEPMVIDKIKEALAIEGEA
ncbi:MAG: thioredoxin family protein [Anaerolineales bacterium]|nr:thioredoxin family protein [Anaerolineales bacterium]